MKVDLSILKREPQLTAKVQLIVEPLAPLSMVAYAPGAYYKTVQIPTKKMLCGVIENILGWHFPLKIREGICKDIKEICKKQKREYNDFKEGSTYIPLLMPYFELESEPDIEFDSVCFYNDLWTRLHSRIDSKDRHIKGCRNVSPVIYNSFLAEYEGIDKNENLTKEEKNAKKKNIVCRFPFYYPTPTKREYVHLKNGKYICNMIFDHDLLDMLEERLDIYNVAYLGNSEGWIDITLKRL